MKNKIRKIIVDNKEYVWMVDNCFDCSTLKIWKNKKLLFTEDFEDKNITPKYVAELVGCIEDYDDIENK
jgi:hypothetical protein